MQGPNIPLTAEMIDAGGLHVNGARYGLNPGLADNSAHLLDALTDESRPAGVGIRLKPGVYEIPAWVAHLQTRDVRLIADVPGQVILRGAGQGLLKLRRDLYIRGIRFEGFGKLIDGDRSGPIEMVHLDRVRVLDSDYAVYWSRLEGSEHVTEMLLEGCFFSGIRQGVVYGSMSCDEIQMRNCRVKDSARYVLRAYSGSGEEARKRIVYSNNWVDGLSNGAARGAQATARVIMASAQRLIVTHNDTRNVWTKGIEATPAEGGAQGNANFVYSSSDVSYIAGNYCQDVGAWGDGSGGIITEKNREQRGCEYRNNTFVQSLTNTTRHHGLNVGGRDVRVDGLYARGLRGAALHSDAATRLVASDIQVSEHRGAIAIRIFGGRVIKLNSPQIDGVVNVVDNAEPRGIEISTRTTEASVNPDPTRNDVWDVRIDGAQIRNVLNPGTQKGIGILLWPLADGATVRQIAITNGSIHGCDKAVEITASAGATIVDVEIRGMDMRTPMAGLVGNRVGLVNTVPVNPVDPANRAYGPSQLIVRDCQGYRTENSGQVNMSAASTQVVVSHGLARMPEARNIQIWMLSTSGAMSEAYVDPGSITATQFTIKAAVAAGQVVTFGWRASAVNA